MSETVQAGDKTGQANKGQAEASKGQAGAAQTGAAPVLRVGAAGRMNAAATRADGPERVDSAARRSGASERAKTDAVALEAELRRRVRGEVRFDDGSRALYSTDASNYRQVPIGVVVPLDKEDIVEAVAAAREFGAPVLARGGGTSLAGQCCNVAVVMDFSKYMHRVLEIDPERRLARVEPGCVLDDLRHAAEAHGLTFGPDPATHTHCT